MERKIISIVLDRDLSLPVLMGTLYIDQVHGQEVYSFEYAKE